MPVADLPALRASGVVLSLLLIALVGGCRVVKTAVDVPGKTVQAVTPGKKDKRPVDPIEVQQTVLRLADEFLNRMVLALDKLDRGTNFLESVRSLQWKIAFSTETTSIASGPNVIANLLDLTVFVSVTRLTFEDDPQSEVFGHSGSFIVETCRNVETNLWRFAANLLTKEQQAELREAIQSWHQQNPGPESILTARGVGFTSRLVTGRTAGAEGAENVFSFLKMDPLSGLDPAVREITQTRLFAERALYVAQKMPLLLRWQTELLSINTMNLSPVGQLITNSTILAASVERFASVAEKLPSQLAAEREEILKALENHENNLSPLVKEVRQAFNAGTDMSISLNTLFTTFDGVMKRLGVGETNSTSSPNTNSEPFRIQDYAQTATELAGTARQLTEMLVTLDHTLGSTNLTKLSTQMSPVIQGAQSSGKEMADYLFWKASLLVVVVLVAILIYRFVVARFFLPARSNSTST